MPDCSGRGRVFRGAGVDSRSPRTKRISVDGQFQALDAGEGCARRRDTGCHHGKRFGDEARPPQGSRRDRRRSLPSPLLSASVGPCPARSIAPSREAQIRAGGIYPDLVPETSTTVNHSGTLSITPATDCCHAVSSCAGRVEPMEPSQTVGTPKTIASTLAGRRGRCLGDVAARPMAGPTGQPHSYRFDSTAQQAWIAIQGARRSVSAVIIGGDKWFFGCLMRQIRVAITSSPSSSATAKWLPAARAGSPEPDAAHERSARFAAVLSLRTRCRLQ